MANTLIEITCLKLNFWSTCLRSAPPTEFPTTMDNSILLVAQARNTRVFLDFCLSLHPLLNPLVNTICFTLKDIQIFRISPHLTFSTATTQVQAAVISHPHYCKCFLISLSLYTCPYLPHEQSTMISLTLSPPFLPLFAYWPVMLLCQGHCTCCSLCLQCSLCCTPQLSAWLIFSPSLGLFSNITFSVTAPSKIEVPQHSLALILHYVFLGTYHHLAYCISCYFLFPIKLKFHEGRNFWLFCSSLYL